MSNVNPYVNAICDKCKQPKNTQYHLVLEKRFVCKDEFFFALVIQEPNNTTYAMNVYVNLLSG